MSSRVFTRLSLLLVFFLATACGGGDDDPLQPLAPPPVNPNLTVLSQGTLDDIEVPANSAGEIAPSTLMTRDDGTAPCERLVFLFSWRTEDKKSIRFSSRTQQQGDVKVSEGAEGVASISGCVVLGMNNDSARKVKLELRYVLAETR